jgi:hypothetical protein
VDGLTRGQEIRITETNPNDADENEGTTTPP